MIPQGILINTNGITNNSFNPLALWQVEMLSPSPKADAPLEPANLRCQLALSPAAWLGSQFLAVMCRGRIIISPLRATVMIRTDLHAQLMVAIVISFFC